MNNEHHKSFKIMFESVENYGNLRIPCEDHENPKQIIELDTRILTKINETYNSTRKLGKSHKS